MLRSIFEHGHHEQGLRAMEILRNMSFNVANRSSLLVSGKLKFRIIGIIISSSKL